MTRPKGIIDEIKVQALVDDFVEKLKELVIRMDGEHVPRPDTEDIVDQRLRRAISHALQTEFAGLHFIGIGNPLLSVCDMPNNSHPFKPNAYSKHCSQCGADYCGAHSLSNCVKCNNGL